ncbi:hypothetical protein ACOSP6_11080 [Tenacibaculum sp. MEBiC06402]|uniref:hypothetical protein n=1 Tax=unclassified Tenacibaculum TaxID=2635139 RepID=UPI003B9A503F
MGKIKVSDHSAKHSAYGSSIQHNGLQLYSVYTDAKVNSIIQNLKKEIKTEIISEVKFLKQSDSNLNEKIESSLGNVLDKIDEIPEMILSNDKLLNLLALKVSKILNK